MGNSVLPRESQLHTSQAAGFFVHRTHVRHLSPFMDQECSLAEAAQVLEISKSRMSYWVNKLLEMGLIEVLRIEKRGKHRVPIYRSVAEVFRVPLTLIPLTSGESLLEVQRLKFDQQLEESLIQVGRMNPQNWHIRFSLEGTFWRLDLLPNDRDKESLELVNEWGRLRLSKAQAKTFRQELMALVKRYSNITEEGGSNHLYKLVLVEEISH